MRLKVGYGDVCAHGDGRGNCLSSLQMTEVVFLCFQSMDVSSLLLFSVFLRRLTACSMIASKDCIFVSIAATYIRVYQYLHFP